MTQTLSGVLLVEDDEGDALLVRECLVEAGIAEGDVTWRRTVADGIDALAANPSCVLLDLGLPDAQGLEALQSMVAQESSTPVIVLTGRNDRTGVEAVAAGAQDYLVKDDITPELLDRTIRYAVQRRHAQLTEFQLREERILAAENGRLERGLLPRPLLRTDFVTCASHYRPGRARAVLGGDFFDVVETDGGSVRAIIGDVMGHGPDEAALGVHLRVAWRGLVLAGVPDDAILATLSRLLEAESGGGIFATVCHLTIARDLTVVVRTAGHPPPLVTTGGRAAYLDVEVAPPLGVRLDGQGWPAEWQVTRTRLQPDSSVVLYTDGLLDAYRCKDDDDIGLEALLATADGQPAATLIETVIGAAPHNAADDTAIVLLTVGGAA